MNKYEEILKSIWLDNNESKVYLQSIKLWTIQASIIWKKLWIPRTTARYACENLVSKQLMIKTKKGNSMLFTAEPPQKIKNIVEIQKNKLEENSAKVNQIMPDLMWLYNPYTKLPKVTFYEWEEGIKKILDDSLTAKETIDTIADVESIINKIPEINKKYIKSRIDAKIKKRWILSNTTLSKEYIEKKYNDDLNDFKLINSKEYNIYISFMIYDWKVSYITMSESLFISVIIEDENIYNFHKNIFKFMWNNLK